jgi:hypothetical protein
MVMFKQLSTAAAALSLSLFSGCAIHPVPEDVTGLDTGDIVKQIRCETRDAARAVVIRYLKRRATELNDQLAGDLAQQFEANPGLMDDFDPQKAFRDPHYKQVQNVFEVIYSAGVAYNFQLTMTEDNNLSPANANFLGAWAATFTLGLAGDFNRTRDNVRTFTITDTIGFLLRNLNAKDFAGGQYCDGHVAWGPNYIYPIAGRIGIYNTVYTFFELTFYDGLSAGKAPAGTTGGGTTGTKSASTTATKGASTTTDTTGAPTMTDQLTFTTTLDVSASPKVVFAQRKTGFQITDASFTGLVRRKDAHQVTVGLALDPKGKAIAALESLRGYIFAVKPVAGARSAAGGALVTLNRVTASTRTPAEQLAVLAIDQLKSREVQLIPSPIP